jgi:hypothetical protein
MLSPEAIISWLLSKVKGMRRSRLKTLAALVSAATRRIGVGVLALGRAMPSAVGAKHRIKRVWRFLRNPMVETQAVLAALAASALPRRGPLVVLVDWTDLPPWRTLIVALARDGRSLPFFSKTIEIDGGSMLDAEEEALEFLERCLPAGRRVIVVADRGFGHCRWIEAMEALGWGYVLRLRSQVMVRIGEARSKLSRLGLGRGAAARDWGPVALSDYRPTPTRLVTLWRADAKEPWYLATNLAAGADSVVDLYSRRMWIDAAIRDIKNRSWGLGAGQVRLSGADRHDRHFLVLFVAYFLLSALGAAAEARGHDRLLKANTVGYRVLSLATIGFLALQVLKLPIARAVKYLPMEITI